MYNIYDHFCLSRTITIRKSIQQPISNYTFQSVKIYSRPIFIFVFYFDFIHLEVRKFLPLT